MLKGPKFREKGGLAHRSCLLVHQPEILLDAIGRIWYKLVRNRLTICGPSGSGVLAYAPPPVLPNQPQPVKLYTLEMRVFAERSNERLCC